MWRRSALQALRAPRAGQSGDYSGPIAARQRLSLCRSLLGAAEGDPITDLNVFYQYLGIEETEGEAAAARWADRYLVEEAVMRRALKKQEFLLRCMDSFGLPLVGPSTSHD